VRHITREKTRQGLISSKGDTGESGELNYKAKMIDEEYKRVPIKLFRRELPGKKVGNGRG